MAAGKINTDKSKWRALVSVAAVLCVLLSSCAVKQGIKSWLLVDQATEQAATPPSGLKNVFVHTAPVACLYHLSSASLLAQKAPGELSGAFIAALAGAFYPFLYGGGLAGQVQKPPYYRSKPLLAALPVFLRYRRLII